MSLKVENLAFSYNKRERIINGVSFEAEPGQVTSIIGANGAGKTTLLRCIASQFHHDGEVMYNGKCIDRQTAVEKISYLEQNTDCDADLTVFEIVLLGMVQTLGFRVSPEDIDRVNSILDLVGIRNLSGKKIGEISGGQRQLVFIAQALVKGPEILILDEPTSALDLYNQMVLMGFIHSYTHTEGCVTIATLHHIDVAMSYSDNIVVLNNGTVVKSGNPELVVDEDLLRDVYKVRSEFVVGKDGRRHMIVNGPVDTDPMQ